MKTNFNPLLRHLVLVLLYYYCLTEKMQLQVLVEAPKTVAYYLCVDVGLVSPQIKIDLLISLRAV